MKYRRKPGEIEAWCAMDLLRAAREDWSQMPAPVDAAYSKGNVMFLSASVQVLTDFGWESVSNYDMLIFSPQGELYPCKAEKFTQLYEAITE